MEAADKPEPQVRERRLEQGERSESQWHPRLGQGAKFLLPSCPPPGHAQRTQGGAL